MRVPVLEQQKCLVIPSVSRTRFGVPHNSRTLGKRLAASTELLPHDVELPEGKWMKVIYSGDKELLDLEEVRALWQVGFGRICSLEQVEQAIDNSFLVQAAYTENEGYQKLVGLSRCLSDEMFAVLFADVCVDPKYRGRGIAKQLIRSLHSEAKRKGLYGFAAFPNPDNYEFLLKCGFVLNRRFYVMTYDP